MITYAHVHKAYGQPWVWLIGVVNTKRHISGDPGSCRRFEAKSSQLFGIRSDAYISRSGDFRADDNDNNFTPCAHVRGVIILH